MYNAFFVLELLRGLTGGAAGGGHTPGGYPLFFAFCVQLSRFGSSARSVVLLRLIHSDRRGRLKNRVKIIEFVSTSLNIYLTAY